MRKAPPPGTAGIGLVVAACSVLSTGLGGANVCAHSAQIEVLVEQIDGVNIYLRAGTYEGISVNDTLFVLDESGERQAGALFVVSASTNRSVVSFVNEPFPLTRGTMLRIRVGPEDPPPGDTPLSPPTAPEPSEQPVNTPRSQSRAYPRVRGRLSLQFNTMESTTSWMSNEEERVNRRFTTPSLGLRLAVSDLPAGMMFTANMRGTYRHSSNDLVQPAHSVRMYQVGIEKSFERVPVQIQLGRFYNRYESYSGYWDGLLLRYGKRDFGFGMVAGFEPNRANEGASTGIPKYTAFVDFNLRGERRAYHTDLSFHRLLPRDDSPDQTLLGWTQRMRLGKTRLGTDIEIHRDSDRASWSISRLHTRGSLPVSQRVSLYARYAFDRPGHRLASIQLLSYERQQASAGLRYWDQDRSISLHATANRFNRGDLSYSVSSAFSLSHTQVLGLGFHGAGTLWMLENTRVIDILTGIDRAIGEANLRASYQLYRYVGTSSSFVTHTVDVGVVFSLGSRVYSTVNARAQRGANLSSNSLFVNLWTSF